MRPILDIITITKDDFEGISATINSTRMIRSFSGVRQTVVDSSLQGTADKVRELALKESNVHYEWQKPMGISPAFNRGLDLSGAKWVWFLNGRDEMHPDLDLAMFLNILSSSHAEILIFELVYKQSKSRYIHPPIWKLWPPVQYWVPHPATLVRRELFETYGRFNNKYKIAMDGELWFRLFSKGALVDLLSIPISLYDEGGMSRQNPSYTAREGRQIISENLIMLLRFWLSNGWAIVKWWWIFHKKS